MAFPQGREVEAVFGARAGAEDADDGPSFRPALRRAAVEELIQHRHLGMVEERAREKIASYCREKCVGRPRDNADALRDEGGDGLVEHLVHVLLGDSLLCPQKP